MSACDRAIAHSKNLNIDECETVFVEKNIITIRITDSEIAEVKQNQEQNLGIRIIHENKIATGQTRKTDDVEELLKKIYDNSSSLKSRDFWKGLPKQTQLPNKIEGTFDSRLKSMTGETAIDLAQEMINSATDTKVTTISGSLNVVWESFQIQNSNDLSYSDEATYIAGMINADSEEGSIPVSGIGQASCRTLSEFTPEQVGRDAAKMCIESINPQKCEEKTYSVIFEPYSVGELLAFVFASNFSHKIFSEKKSCFSEKINQKVAVDNFTLVDDPHKPEGIASKAVDDEGVPTKKQSLIENGVFQATYCDLFDAYKQGVDSTGNASRMASPMGRDADPMPISAPHNLRVQSGNQSQDEIIKDTKNGLLVGRLWYTYAVNPIKGDFSCTARSGIRIIKDGEIKNPGKSVRIVHNLPVMLENISAIANNERNVLQWSSLPSITPSLKADGIKVIPIN